MNVSFILIIFSFLIWLLPITSINSNEILIVDNSNTVNITRDTYFTKTNNKVSKDYLDKLIFEKIDNDIYLSSISKEYHIFKFQIRLKDKKKYYLKIDDSSIYFIELYFKNYNSSFNNIFINNQFIIPIESSNENELIEIFITIHSFYALNFSFFLSNEIDTFNDIYFNNLFYGFFLGFVFLSIIYLLILYLYIKKDIVLFYLLFVIINAIFFLSKQNILPFDYVNNSFFNSCLIFFIHILGLFITLKLMVNDQEYLKIKKYKDIVIYIIIFLFIISFNSESLINYYFIITLDFILISVLIISLMTLNNNWKNYHFQISFIIYIIGFVCIFFKNIFITNWKIFNHFSFEISFLIHLVYFGTVLSLKYSIFHLLNSNISLLSFNTANFNDISNTITILKNKNDYYLNELEKAGDIQKSFMPSLNTNFPLIKISYYLKNVLQVGGDFFDIIPLKNNSIAIYIGDVSGHGIAAAILTTLFKITFRNSLQKFSNPEKIFNDVNNQTNHIITTNDYLTSFLLIIHNDGKLEYSSAAHKPIFIFRKKTSRCEFLISKGSFLGMKSIYNPIFECKIDKLEVGDRILLFTDGVLLNDKNKKWNMDVLFNSFAKSQSKSFDIAINSIIEDWENILQEENLNDDSTFLYIEFKGE
jgi:phosphoserine phosphatase RsbU/P